MAAIDDYQLDIEAQLVPLKELVKQFEKRIEYFSLPAFIISLTPWMLCCYFIFVPTLKGFAGWLIIILFYYGYYTVSQTSKLKMFLAKSFMNDYSRMNDLKIEITDLERKINIVSKAKYLLSKLNINELPIKREIDRTNLLGFKKSLEDLEFKNYTNYEFNSNIWDPCTKILDRIANYSSIDTKPSKKNNPTTPTSPAKQALRAAPSILAEPKEAQAHSFITTLASLFSVEKPEIRDKNLIHSRDVSVPPSERKDYFKISETNAELGLQGELFVIEQERRRLTDLKRLDLADKIAHTSKNEGDHFGYDIVSFDEFGNEKFIEVKTSSQGFASLFYLTNNELFTLNQNGNYFIYRVYNFNLEKKSGSIYIIDLLNGDLLKYFTMEPILFKILPNPKNTQIYTK